VRSVDLHSHVLPGVDDGPASLEGSLELARAAVATGTVEMVATPHIDDERRIEPREVASAVAAFNAQLEAEGLDLRVRTGGEIALPRILDLDDADLESLRLGGGPYVLLESPLAPVAGTFEPLIRHVRERGHRVLLAHPERCPAFQRTPARLAALVEEGVLVQITAGALKGAFGQHVREFSLELLRRDLVHVVASDAHDAHRRPPGTLAAVRGVERNLPGIAARALWLTAEVPAAILAGTAIPPALPLPKTSRPWHRLARAAPSLR
jgi:protein-tyrosine phosphatase